MISWILASLETIIIDCVLDYTTTVHELWTWIHTLLEPISLPPVNDPIPREVMRGRNIGNKGEESSSGSNPAERGSRGRKFRRERKFEREGID